MLHELARVGFAVLLILGFVGGSAGGLALAGLTTRIRRKDLRTFIQLVMMAVAVAGLLGSVKFLKSAIAEKPAPAPEKPAPAPEKW